MSKSRMVSFRLNEEEYGELLQLSYRRGSLSMSDLARAGIEMLLHTRPEEERHSSVEATPSLEQRLLKLEHRIASLSVEFKKWKSLSGIANPASLRSTRSTDHRKHFRLK